MVTSLEQSFKDTFKDLSYDLIDENLIVIANYIVDYYYRSNLLNDVSIFSLVYEVEKILENYRYTVNVPDRGKLHGIVKYRVETFKLINNGSNSGVSISNFSQTSNDSQFVSQQPLKLDTDIVVIEQPDTEVVEIKNDNSEEKLITINEDVDRSILNPPVVKFKRDNKFIKGFKKLLKKRKDKKDKKEAPVITITEKTVSETSTVDDKAINIQSVIEVITEFPIEEVKEGVSNIIDEIKETISDITTGKFDEVPSDISNIVESVSETIEIVSDALSGLKDISDEVKNLEIKVEDTDDEDKAFNIQTINQVISDFPVEEIKESVTNVINDIKETVNDVSNGKFDEVQTDITNVVNGVSETVAIIGNAITSAINELKSVEGEQTSEQPEEKSEQPDETSEQPDEKSEQPDEKSEKKKKKSKLAKLFGGSDDENVVKQLAKISLENAKKEIDDIDEHDLKKIEKNIKREIKQAKAAARLEIENIKKKAKLDEIERKKNAIIAKLTS